MSEYSKYIIYVDESGDAHWKAAPEFPVLCLNFCLFEKEYYINTLIPAFNRLKFKYWGSDNIILHERDIRHPRKMKDTLMKAKYEILKGEVKINFLNELTSLMAEAEFKSFCILLVKQKVPQSYHVYDPYHICLSRGFRQISDYLKIHDPSEARKPLHIVFEKRDHTSDTLLSQAYQKIRLQGSLMSESQEYSFENYHLELVDKKANSTGLQIADLTARPIANHYLNKSKQKLETDQRAMDTIIDKLLFCTKSTCTPKQYDIFHQALQ